jgi:hypothetical protein
MLASNISRDIGYSDRHICGFPQAFKVNSGTVPPLGQDRFLSNHFEFIIHESPFHSKLQSSYRQHHDKTQREDRETT